MCSNYRGSHSSASLARSIYGTGEEGPPDSSSDSGGTLWFSSWMWSVGPTLHPQRGPGVCLGVVPTSPHVYCGSGEGPSCRLSVWPYLEPGPHRRQ